ncbi:hypothetical protein [Streptomyces sp. NPDC058657]|uniref:hypothetical protein n=1 Tax=unclassified Streptomyces TaxID=2593676 RepID=UPI00364D909E
MKDISGAHLTYRIHPDHAELVDEVIDWYEITLAGLERAVVPSAADDYRRQGLARALLVHGMRRARAADARHMTAACQGAPGHPGRAAPTT